MYPLISFGEKPSVYVPSTTDVPRRENFLVVPSSQFSGQKFVEEPSDQSGRGLRRYRRLWGDFDERRAEDLTRQLGESLVARRRANQGKPITGEIFYELIEDDRVNYFIPSSNGERIFKLCNLSVRRGRTLYVEVEFSRNAIGNIVEMMSRLWAMLDAFEADGQNCKPLAGAEPDRVQAKTAGRS